MSRNGKMEKITTEYVAGLWITSRKSTSGTLSLEYGNGLTGLFDFNPTRVGENADVAVALFSNGTEVAQGRFRASVTQQTTTKIGLCTYQVFVVRRTIALNGRDPINEEALYSPMLGLVIANVTMTQDWQPKTGVFFDRLEVRKNE